MENCNGGTCHTPPIIVSIMQDSIENIQPEELNGDATSPTTSVETSADDEKKQLSDIDNSAESAE